MPETLIYQTMIWNRDRWVKERDDTKNGPVPKGAAKVSMGDAIKKFHAAAAKGLKEGHKEAGELKKTIASYKSAIKVKYPVFHKLIETKLEKNLDSYLTEGKKVLDGVKDYPNLRAAASTAILVTGSEFHLWEKAGSKGKFTPSNLSNAKAALSAFVTALQKATYYNDKITKAESDLFNKTAYAFDGGALNKPTIEGLVKQLKELPPNI
jgi:enolase